MWKPLNLKKAGFLLTLSDLIASVELSHPGIIPDFSNARCLFIASDYGGEHRSARYQTISYLFCDFAQCVTWQAQRENFRATYLPDGRRMAFKSLNDCIRRRALEPYLSIVNTLPGISLTFVIHKKITSLFRKVGKLDTNNFEIEALHTIKADDVEKMLRVVHLLSLLLSGISSPAQDILWVTDEDTIVANDARLKLVVEILGRVSSHCLPHDLGHLRVATSKSDKGDLSLEDMLSIPDIIAGTLSDVIDTLFGEHGMPAVPLTLPRADVHPEKVLRVMDWFSDNNQKLKRVVVVIDEVPTTRKLRATHLYFHGFPTII